MVAIPTARGDEIDSSELGFTLPVEIVFLITGVETNLNWPDLSFDAVPEEERIADAVAKFEVAAAHGVNTIIDRTIPGIGRDVARIKQVAEQVDVNILVCTGYYTWHQLPFFFSFKSADPLKERFGTSRPSLEDVFVRDIEVGIGDTGVRAVAIKCVTDHFGLTEGVTQAVRATARAHRRTGAPITTHTGIGLGVASAALQQQVFEEEGVDLSRVMYGHIDFTPPDVSLDEFKRLLDTGASISFDRPAGPPDAVESRYQRITELCAAGYADRVMVSNDNCCWQDLIPEDLPMPTGLDQPPYTHAVTTLIPELLKRGVTEAQIEQMTQHNPRRFLESRGLGAY